MLSFRHSLVFTLVLFSFGAGATAYAADQTGRNSPTFFKDAIEKKLTRTYSEAVDRILSTRQFSVVDFMSLRSVYPKTPQYTPFSDEILDKMMQLAYEIKATEDLNESQKILDQYNDIIRKHFANIEVIFMAANLSEDDARLGNAPFFKKVREGLYESLWIRGDGKTLQNAIKIYTFGEEDIILKRYGGRLISSNIYNDKNDNTRFINIHDIKNLKTGKVEKLFIDVSTPIVESEGSKVNKKRAFETGMLPY